MSELNITPAILLAAYVAVGWHLVRNSSCTCINIAQQEETGEAASQSGFEFGQRKQRESCGVTMLAQLGTCVDAHLHRSRVCTFSFAIKCCLLLYRWVTSSLSKKVFSMHCIILPSGEDSLMFCQQTSCLHSMRDAQITDLALTTCYRFRISTASIRVNAHAATYFSRCLAVDSPLF